MGWGEPFPLSDRSTGTTGQIEEAHRLLDELHFRSGPLAIRIVEVAYTIKKLRGELTKENENGFDS